MCKSYFLIAVSIDCIQRIAKQNRTSRVYQSVAEERAIERYSSTLLRRKNRSQIQQKVDTLQNFLLKEISVLRREMKDSIRTTVASNTEKFIDINQFPRVGKNLKLFLEECRNKDKIYLNGKSQTFFIKITQLHFRNQKNQKQNLEIQGILITVGYRPTETFSRFDWLSEGES